MQSFWNPLAVHKPSPNFWTDRLGHDMSDPSWVVLHTMVCCEPAAWARFKNPAQQASSTYGVKLDGTFVQYVDEKDGPWTDGTSSGVGSNLDVITLEHEDCGDYNGPRTEELYRTSALLVREICNRYGIPIDRTHVIKHNECFLSSTACPDSLDVDRIVRMAAGSEALPGAAPAPGGASAPPPPPIPLEDDDMGAIAYLDTDLELGQQHVLYVDDHGALIQLVYATSTGKWSELHLATGLVPQTPVTAKVVDRLKQVQVVARMTDGRILHAWAAFGGGFAIEHLGEPTIPPVAPPA